jgi:hypothetical protein
MTISGYRIREAKARFEADEKAALEAKLAPAKQELAKTLSRSDKFLKLDFIQPLAKIAQLIQDGVAAVDLATNYPTTTEPQSGNSGKEEFYQFVYEILPRRGFTLSENGSMRLLYFVIAQARGKGANMSSIDTWSLAFDKLWSLDAFDIGSAEVGWDESKVQQEPVVEQPAPEPTVADLETLNLSLSREDERTAQKIVSNAVFGPSGQAAELFQQFIAHVSKTFGHDLTESEQRELIDVFRTRNLSFLDHRAYDKARCELVAKGVLPRTCYTQDELLCLEIESTPTHDKSDYDQRLNLKRQIATARIAASRRD